jgi:hypothetical protein
MAMPPSVATTLVVVLRENIKYLLVFGTFPPLGVRGVLKRFT